MKKFLLFSVVAALLFSCGKTSSPKETAQAFIQAVYAADITTAADYVSSESKAVLDKAKTGAKPMLAAEESFQLATLTETITDKTATVKNEVVSVPLVKEEDGWKVALTEELLTGIQSREELLSTLKKNWNTLVKEYEGRVIVARDYIKYKKSQGALSPQATALGTLLDSFAPPKEWSKETLLAYVQKQQQLNSAIDGALEPSLAANTDLTMNYFLQISNAGDRIKAAEMNYQLLAEKAHSPLYVPLPVKTTKNM